MEVWEVRVIFGVHLVLMTSCVVRRTYCYYLRVQEADDDRPELSMHPAQPLGVKFIGRHTVT